MSRPLYLHEVVDVVGEGAMDYMAHVVGFDADVAADRSLALVGTWYVTGSTGRWPQVVNLWEVLDGWDGWRRLMEATNLRRSQNRPLGEWWRAALESRSGGFDRLLGAAPGTRTLAELRAGGVTGSVFVHELTEVRPGAQADYLAMVREERVPIMSDHGHVLVGLYEALMNDVEVVTIWATTPGGHVDLMRATDDATDPRAALWAAHRRALAVRWREELMTPAPGTPMSAGDAL